MSAKVLAVFFALLAVSAMSEAAKTKIFTDKPIGSSGKDISAKLGDTGILVRDLGGSNRLYQSGIYVDVTSKAKLLNYQLTVDIVDGSGDFPTGSIFAVGSGTGIQDDSVTLPKSIVGGTGPYVNATGVISSQGDQFNITLF